MQRYTSAETSLNQIPALFKNTVFERGGINLDWGGGKYDKGTDAKEGDDVITVIMNDINNECLYRMDFVK